MASIVPTAKEASAMIGIAVTPTAIAAEKIGARRTGC